MTNEQDDGKQQIEREDAFMKELFKLVELVRRGLSPELAREILGELIRKHGVSPAMAEDAEATLEVAIVQAQQERASMSSEAFAALERGARETFPKAQEDKAAEDKKTGTKPK